MNRTFSIATLLLVMAIVAVALTSLREVVQRADGGGSPIGILSPVLACSVAGATFGYGLAIWNSVTPVWMVGGWLRLFVSTVCGLFLGAAAGAQATVRVDWYVLLLTPIVIVGCAALVAATRRQRAASSPAIADRAAHFLEPDSSDSRAPADKSP